MTHDEKILDEHCPNCNGRLKQYPVTQNGETVGHAIGCPQFYINDNCQEEIRTVEK